MSEIITGTIFFASDKATRNRYFREGQRVRIVDFHSVRYLSETFAQVELDQTGTSYVHVTIDGGPAFTAEDPWPHVDAGHSIECGNQSDYCRTCRMTIARHYWYGPSGAQQRGTSPLGYTPSHDGGMAASWPL